MRTYGTEWKRIALVLTGMALPVLAQASSRIESYLFPIISSQSATFLFRDDKKICWEWKFFKKREAWFYSIDSILKYSDQLNIKLVRKYPWTDPFPVIIESDYVDNIDLPLLILKNNELNYFRRSRTNSKPNQWYSRTLCIDTILAEISDNSFISVEAYISYDVSWRPYRIHHYLPTFEAPPFEDKK